MKRILSLTAAALLGLMVLVGLGRAQVEDNITVYSTVIFSRMGERTPVLNLANETVHLTSYGAEQMYQMASLSFVTIKSY
jgi:hypothetical protein